MNTSNQNLNSGNNAMGDDFSYLSRLGGYFLVIDYSGKIEFISPNLTQNLQLERNNWIGQDIFSLVNLSDRSKIKKALGQVNGSASFIDAFTFKQGKKRYFDASLTKSLRQNGTYTYVFNLHDITKRWEHQEDLALKNKELDSFVYKVSHDLKAPLRSIEGLVNLSKINSQNKDEYLNLINTGVFQLKNYISELSTQVRVPDIELSKVNCCKIIKELIRDLRFIPEAERITFNYKVHNDTPIFTDSFSLTTVLRNLVSNAIKYHESSRQRPFVNINVSSDSHRFSIQVEDNGIGIEETELTEIFSMFHRATAVNEGTGLGLSIANEAAKRIAGTLEARSVWNQGTTFTLSARNYYTA